MSSVIRAWYVFVLLGLVTFLLTAFVGRVPADLTAAVALPHDLLHRAGVNLKLTLQSAVDRRDLRGEVARLQEELALTEQARRDLELQLGLLQQADQPGLPVEEGRGVGHPQVGGVGAGRPDRGHERHRLRPPVVAGGEQIAEPAPVDLLADDRAFRRLATLIEATTRTNYYQVGGRVPTRFSGGVPYTALKLAAPGGCIGKPLYGQIGGGHG